MNVRITNIYRQMFFKLINPYPIKTVDVMFSLNCGQYENYLRIAIDVHDLRLMHSSTVRESFPFFSYL